MNILFDCYAIDIQMENHLHCIVPNDEIYGVYARKHHIVEMRGDVTDAGQTNNEQQLKIELLSQWKLEAESRNSPER